MSLNCSYSTAFKKWNLHQLNVNTSLIMLYSILYSFNENIDYTLAFKEKQIPPQCDFEPRLVRLILTEFQDFFFFLKSRFQTQINFLCGPMVLYT